MAGARISKERPAENTLLLADVRVNTDKRELNLRTTIAIPKKEYADHVFTIESGSLIINSNQRAYYDRIMAALKPTGLDQEALKRELPEGTLQTNELQNYWGIRFRDVAWAAGSAYTLKVDGQERYLCGVWRDSGALYYPNMVDSSSGVGSTHDPFITALSESTDELLVIRKGVVLLPQLNGDSPSRLHAYNGLLREKVGEKAERMGYRTETLKSGYAIITEDQRWRLDNMQVTATFDILTRSSDQKKTPFFEFALPSMILNIGTDSAGFSIRDTIAIETEGKVLERNVVLMHMKDGKVSIYQEGKKVEQFENFYEFGLNSGVSSKTPFTPGFMLVLKGLEKSDFPADGQLRDFVEKYQMPFCE